MLLASICNLCLVYNAALLVGIPHKIHVALMQSNRRCGAGGLQIGFKLVQGNLA